MGYDFRSNSLDGRSPKKLPLSKEKDHFTVVAFREGSPLDTGAINAIDQLEMSGYVSVVPPFHAPSSQIVREVVQDVSWYHPKHRLGIKGGQGIERTSGRHDGTMLWPTGDCGSDEIVNLRQHLVTFLRHNKAKIFDNLPPTPYYIGFTVPSSLCLPVGKLTVMRTCMEFYEVIGRYELEG